MTSSSGPARERGGVPRPQDGAPSSTSVDVLAAQVRDALHWDHVKRPDRAQALLALRALVARAKEAEERAEAHLLLRKEAVSWAEEVELERDALVARVTEAEDAQHLLADCQRGRKAAQDEAFRRGDEVDRLTAALADARNALAFYAEADNYVALPRRVRPAIEDAGDRAREVLARLDGSSEPDVLRCPECGSPLKLGHDCLAGARLDGNQE